MTPVTDWVTLADKVQVRCGGNDMTATQAPKVAARGRGESPRRGDRVRGPDLGKPVPLPALKGRRNPKWIALGIVALCLGALGAYFLYTDLSKAQTVVAVSTTIYRGSLVEAADLTVVTVGSTPGVQTVPGEQLESLVGQRATVDVMGGSLLPVDAIAPTLVPATDRALVGLSLPVGRAPQGYLQPGSAVRLVALSPEGSDPAYVDKYSNLAIQARVVDSAPGADGLSLLVNVDVAADQAATVGTLAAGARLVVIRDADR